MPKRGSTQQRPFADAGAVAAVCCRGLFLVPCARYCRLLPRVAGQHVRLPIARQALEILRGGLEISVRLALAGVTAYSSSALRERC
jgi:hypothetical protein